MLAERYLRRRFEEGKEEGREEGKELGRELGKEEGKELGLRRGRRYAEKLQIWNNERLEAAEKGEPFDKPMPEFDDETDE